MGVTHSATKKMNSVILVIVLCLTTVGANEFSPTLPIV
jgi:hypothetical protein